MIVRPPQKKPLSKLKFYPSFSQKVANDNQPAKKLTLGWILLGLGLCLIFTAFFWI